MSSPSATTSLPIDTTQLAPREPSICIPRVFANITEARVLAIFENLDLGQIERVDMIQLTNDKGEKFQRVFVHFTEWYDTTESGELNESAIEVRQRLPLAGPEATGRKGRVAGGDPSGRRGARGGVQSSAQVERDAQGAARLRARCAFRRSRVARRSQSLQFLQFLQFLQLQ